MSDPHPMPPFERFFDLHDLTEAGSDVRFVATPEQRAALARWAEVDAVETFEALVTLQKRSPSHFSYDAKLTADVVQACVVTLEPVHSHIEAQVERALHLTIPRRMPRHRYAQIEIPIPPITAGGDGDDGPEEISSPHYDVAGPLLEDFLLSIDPYPRAPGVTFEVLADGDAAKPESPFAVLKALKTKGG